MENLFSGMLPYWEKIKDKAKFGGGGFVSEKMGKKAMQDVFIYLFIYLFIFSLEKC